MLRRPLWPRIIGSYHFDYRDSHKDDKMIMIFPVIRACVKNIVAVFFLSSDVGMCPTDVSSHGLCHGEKLVLESRSYMLGGQRQAGEAEPLAAHTPASPSPALLPSSLEVLHDAEKSLVSQLGHLSQAIWVLSQYQSPGWPRECPAYLVRLIKWVTWRNMTLLVNTRSTAWSWLNKWLRRRLSWRKTLTE